MTIATATTGALRRAVLLVALLNLAYGVAEFTVALRIGSVSLFADSVDFFEDASVNLLIFFALAWSLKARARVGMALAAILLIPGIATPWIAVQKVLDPVAVNPLHLGVTAFGALAINLFCAVLLARHRAAHGSVARAAWLSARNDAFANIGMIGAALVTAFLWRSAWPDLIVGLAIFWVNLDAAKAVWTAARQEHRAATPQA